MVLIDKTKEKILGFIENYSWNTSGPICLLSLCVCKYLHLLQIVAVLDELLRIHLITIYSLSLLMEKNGICTTLAKVT